jgi:hypothetical protein
MKTQLEVLKQIQDEINSYGTPLEMKIEEGVTPKGILKLRDCRFIEDAPICPSQEVRDIIWKFAGKDFTVAFNNTGRIFFLWSTNEN